MIFALSTASTITFSVAGVIIALGLLALLRVVLRKEPSPATWRRYRIGLFVERDPSPKDDDRAGERQQHEPPR